MWDWLVFSSHSMELQSQITAQWCISVCAKLAQLCGIDATQLGLLNLFMKVLHCGKDFCVFDWQKSYKVLLCELNARADVRCVTAVVRRSSLETGEFEGNWREMRWGKKGSLSCWKLLQTLIFIHMLFFVLQQCCLLKNYAISNHFNCKLSGHLRKTGCGLFFTFSFAVINVWLLCPNAQVGVTEPR